MIIKHCTLFVLLVWQTYLQPHIKTFTTALPPASKEAPANSQGVPDQIFLNQLLDNAMLGPIEGHLPLHIVSQFCKIVIEWPSELQQAELAASLPGQAPAVATQLLNSLFTAFLA